MQSDNAVARDDSRTDTLIMVLVLGTAWGFSEVVFSEAIREWGVPYRAGILTGIGLGIMGIALGFNKKVLPLIGIALVAMGAKQLVVPVLQCSVLCKANSCAAVFLQSAALGGAAALAGRYLHGSRPARLVAPLAAALAAAGAFHFIGMRVSPCPYLLSFNHPGGLLSFLGAEGLSWAAFSAILFPVGYQLGEKLRDKIPALRKARPAAYYLAAAGCIAGCYAAIVTVIIKSGV